MPGVDYNETYSEVLDILNHTKKEDVDKISPQFIEYLRSNSSKNYVSKIDHSMNIKDMKLKPETNAVLAIIYRKFWCNEEQLKQFDESLKSNKIAHNKYRNEMAEKTNKYDILFNKKEEVHENKEKQDSIANLISYKESFITKIINKIKLLFKK